MISIDLENILRSSTLIKQGAEAKVYKIEFIKNITDNSSEMALLKYRFPKTYRHSKLDEQLTKHRLTFEARSLSRALKSGISVPLLKGIDLDQGWLILEWIEGMTLRAWLDDQKLSHPIHHQVEEILKDVGIQLAKLHSADIIHGDLTTSNMMLRPKNSISQSTTSCLEVILIDFGLSSVNCLVEDKAVDLYVLERAFLSTHSDPNDTQLKHRSPLFEIILESYGKNLTKANWKAIQTRLNNVRLRGRKRSMIG